MPPDTYTEEIDDYDECDQEMVALVPRNQSMDFKETLPQGGDHSSFGNLQNRSRLRSKSVRQIKKILEDDGVIGTWSSCGITVIFLLVLLVVGGISLSHSTRNSHPDDETSYKGESDEITKWKKLRLQDIKHWCLDPKSHSCEDQCANPLQPHDRIGHKTWSLAHDGNIRDAYHAENIDVVFLGDSITEGWRGMSFGLPVDNKKDNIPVFEKLFSRDKGGDFEGLALGIAGDRSPHLLWRIQNGEVPDQLQPSVWWLLIGTNDFLRADYCSPEVVVMGIKRVIEEMRSLRPGAFIVINSVLPRSIEEMQGQLTLPKHPLEDTVWSGISEANRQIRLYCEKYQNVLFFDATDIFLRKKSESAPGAVENLYIPQSLMEDYIHPTAKGYELWGNEIVKALHKIMDADGAANGRKPLPTWFGLRSKSKPDLNAPSNDEE